MKNLVRVSAIIMLVLGVTGLAFGIVLLVSASSIHNQTVASLEEDKCPVTDIAGLRDLREQLRDARWAFDPPPLDPTNQASINLLVQEKGVGLSLTNLSRAMMYQYAGIGILVLGIGLAAAGVVQYRMAGRMT